VPKLVTRWRQVDIETQAKHYVRSYILFPSGMLGLVCMLGGLGGLGYQLIASGSYTWTTFLVSSGLLLLGGLCGVAQTIYHRYLLKTVPEVFAARMRTAVGKPGKKAAVNQQQTKIDHPGRAFVPLGYVGGLALLLAGSALALVDGAVDALPAILMPWAGFYWGKLFLWRGVVQ
jgi:hypothetical protein